MEDEDEQESAEEWLGCRVSKGWRWLSRGQDRPRRIGNATRVEGRMEQREKGDEEEQKEEENRVCDAGKRRWDGDEEMQRRGGRGKEGERWEVRGEEVR